ncbi:MAG: fluoride efflux transporter CrcB [Deferrisomatales bacterium]
MNHLALVALGAVLGASGRHLLAGWVARAVPAPFPWGTLAVNLVGCLVIGLAWGLTERSPWSPALRAFFFAGVLGSFTTFSSFGLETLNLVRVGEAGRALAYVLASNAGGLALVWLGLAVTRPG